MRFKIDEVNISKAKTLSLKIKKMASMILDTTTDSAMIACKLWQKENYAKEHLGTDDVEVKAESRSSSSKIKDNLL